MAIQEHLDNEERGILGIAVTVNPDSDATKFAYSAGLTRGTYAMIRLFKALVDDAVKVVEKESTKG